MRFDNVLHVRDLLETSSHEAKLMPSFAYGKAKIALLHEIVSIERIQKSVTF